MILFLFLGVVYAILGIVIFFLMKEYEDNLVSGIIGVFWLPVIAYGALVSLLELGKWRIRL